jgi:hypothetical protein
MLKIITEIPEALYKVVFAIFLIPKTLVKVTIAPSWIPTYIQAQLRTPQSEQRFENYTNPIAFFLFTAVAPAILMLPIFYKLAQKINGQIIDLAQVGFPIAIPVPNDFQDAIREFLTDLKSFSIETQFLGVFILLVSWPLGASLAIHLIRSIRQRGSGETKRQKKAGDTDATDFSVGSLRPTILAQSYCFGSLYFYHLAMLAVYFFFGSLWLLIQFCFFYQFYFIYVQVKIVQGETKMGLLKSLVMVPIIFCSAFFLMIVCECIIVLAVFLAKAPIQ